MLSRDTAQGRSNDGHLPSRRSRIRRCRKPGRRFLGGFLLSQGKTYNSLNVFEKIQDPSGTLKVSEHAVSSGDYSFEAHLDGRYTYCFSNENSNVGTKEVSFNVHGIVYVPEEPESSDPLEREVRSLGELLNQVKDEQEYIVVREQVHRNTAESTNSRVKWWSIFQLGVVGGNGVFQVWYLKRFFEVRVRFFWV
jgi:hypothetical protein